MSSSLKSGDRVVVTSAFSADWAGRAGTVLHTDAGAPWPVEVRLDPWKQYAESHCRFKASELVPYAEDSAVEQSPVEAAKTFRQQAVELDARADQLRDLADEADNAADGLRSLANLILAFGGVNV